MTIFSVLPTHPVDDGGGMACLLFAMVALCVYLSALSDKLRRNNMVRTFRFLIVAVLLGMFSLSLVGCSDEGPAEKAGKKVDQAVDKIKDDAKKVFE